MSEHKSDDTRAAVESPPPGEPMPPVEASALLAEWANTHTLTEAELAGLGRVVDAGCGAADLVDALEDTLALRRLANRRLPKEALRALIRRNRESGRTPPTAD